MPRRVRFAFDVEKFPHVVAYLLRQVGPTTRMGLMKLFYLADRIHVVRYGRPVVGGKYCALQEGPISSVASDILEDLAAAKSETSHEAQLRVDYVALLERLVDVGTGKTSPEYFAKAEPDIEKLSESDVEVLNEVEVRSSAS